MSPCLRFGDYLPYLLTFTFNLMFVNVDENCDDKKGFQKHFVLFFIIISYSEAKQNRPQRNTDIQQLIPINELQWTQYKF